MTAILCTSHTIINPFVSSLTQQVTACSNDFLLMKYVGTNGLNVIYWEGGECTLYWDFCWVCFYNVHENVGQSYQTVPIPKGSRGMVLEEWKETGKVRRGGDGSGGRRRKGKGEKAGRGKRKSREVWTLLNIVPTWWIAGILGNNQTIYSAEPHSHTEN